MTETNKMSLDEAIEDRFRELNMLEPGSETRDGLVNELSTLYKLKLEEDQLADDSDLKRKQSAIQTLFNYLKVGTDVVAIVLPLAFYAKWMKAGFEFEKDGTITSTVFRGLISKFRTTR